MRVGSLFSGIGGLDLGLEWAGMEIVWQSEKDPFCRGILRQHWPNARLYDDITTLDATDLAPVDLICGGFPCQPVSLAGRRQGKNDARWLWPAMRDIISHVHPTWVLGENTPGLITMGLDGVLADLEALGYACRTFVVPACAVDAPHRRDRVFVVAHASRGGCDERGASLSGQAGRQAFVGDGGEGVVADASGKQVGTAGQPWEYGHVVDAYGVRLAQSEGSVSEFRGRFKHTGKRSPWVECERITGPDGQVRRVKSRVRLLAHGVPGRVARLKALGNAVVPEVAYQFGRAIMAAHYGYNINPA